MISLKTVGREPDAGSTENHRPYRDFARDHSYTERGRGVRSTRLLEAVA